MRVTVVVGGQAGSEGKGAICGHLHRSEAFELGVRVGGSNAGHSVVDDAGKKWAFRHLPVATVTDRNCELVIASGSEIDLAVLRDEVRKVKEVGYEVKGRLFIDENATVVTQTEKLMESDISTGTTGKGVGAARARRAMREAITVRDMVMGDGDDWIICDTQKMMRSWDCGDILIEGTQGYQLGTHAGSYPFTTSGDCRAQDFMAQAGIAPRNAEVWVVVRMYPIRIAGNSGPLREETDWESIGVEKEFTTVTQKVRRVGEWNIDWVVQAVEANAGGLPVKIALTMVDYDYPELEGKEGFWLKEDLPEGLRERLAEIDGKIHGLGRVAMLGTSDRTYIDLIG